MTKIKDNRVKGLRDTLQLAKNRGYLMHSVNANMVRDQFSIFQNLRHRGKELLETKRIEYLTSTGRRVGPCENDETVLAKLFVEMEVDGLMENHMDEYSKLLQSRVIEAIIGELDHTVRSSNIGGGPGNNFISYADVRLIHFLLQEMVKTILRIEEQNAPGVGDGVEFYLMGKDKLTKKEQSLKAQREAVDLEFYGFLCKGSVWQCWKRAHLIDRRKIRNTILKACPKLNKLRQITFSTFLHALTDTNTLPLYRAESWYTEEALDARKTPGRFQPEVDGNGFIVRGRTATDHPFCKNTHDHKELVNCVVNSFLECNFCDFACANNKQLVDLRKSPFLSQKY